jgi:hypothetical protein
MRSDKRTVPRWMRIAAKVGLVLFISLAIATAFARNWLVAAGMLTFALPQVSMLIATRSDS